MCFRYNWQTSRMPLLWHLSYFSRGQFCLLISTCSFLYPRWVKSRRRGEEGGGEDTVTCQLENLILSLRVSVRAFPGRCGATLGWTLTPQRAHPPTLLPPPEPRGINYSASASMEHFAQIRYFNLVAITKSACETFYFSSKTSTNALI